MTTDTPARYSRYDITRSYEWNYENAPDPVDVAIPAISGSFTFLGRTVASPLGMPAGPLLNGRWILYYASLGFDVLTYKTVRSVARDCYPLPNLQPVATENLTGNEREVSVTSEMLGSWAVSFGMPSKDPAGWRADVEWTRHQITDDKLLSVSVVGSAQPGWSLDDLADDYARCAKWAVESGADCIETNFSCPNVSTRDGQLYQEPDAAEIVAARVRDAIGRTPFLIKIGHVMNRELAETLIDAVGPHIDGIASTNSVATTVRTDDGSLLFDGQCRGICGNATRAASIAQTRLFADVLLQRGLQKSLIGVGGASTADHVREYLAAGAEAVHIATAAMVNPGVALEIREAMSD